MATNRDSKYMEAVNQRIRNDRVWLNNPVMMQGLGLAPIVIADTDGKSALVLIAALCLLMVPTRLLTVLILYLTGNRGHTVLYTLVAAVIYVPIYLLLVELFSADLTLGIYLPLLIADPLINSRSERTRLEEPITALRHGLGTAVGASLVVLIMGLLREFLAVGRMFGYTVYQGQTNLMPLANQPVGGFILLGLVCAIWRSLASAHRHSISTEVRSK